jgi:phosphomethylpyrimidine synthase
MTQLEAAKKGIVTPEMEKVAKKEGISTEQLQKGIALGQIVILKNCLRDTEPVGIGKGLTTKVNANIGTSQGHVDIELEKEKAQVATDAGADTLMDLSTGGDLDLIREEILTEVSCPVGTVPIYQVGMEALSRGSLVDFTAEDIFATIEKQARQGVDFITVHCGVTKEIVERIFLKERLTGIVSRGGAFHADWIAHHGKENPLYEQFDRLLEITREYDVTLSLGDGLRPGSLADVSDEFQLKELLVLGELVQRARSRGVQVMVEGPGHVPIDQIEDQVRLEKEICDGAPFYVLGPLPTDVAMGHDHITAAIGGAIAAKAGADFLCYVTPSEHLSLPSLEDVREGVVATRIAAHVGDIAKLEGADRWDYELSRARGKLDWKTQLKLALDPKKAKQLIKIEPLTGSPCSMCGEYCPMRAERLYKVKTRK